MICGLRPRLFSVLSALTLMAPAAHAQDDQEEPSPTPASAAPVPAEVHAVDPQNTHPELSDDYKTPEPSHAPFPESRRRPSHFLSFGLGKVGDIGKYNHYDKLYGRTNKTGFFHAGYFLYTAAVLDLGLSGRFGYYSAKGHPLTSLNGQSTPVNGDLGDVQTDSRQSIELTLVPVDILFNLAFSPFPVSRRLVIQGWIGPEFTFVQETLKPNIPSSSTVPANSSLVSKGWDQGIVTGVMLSISINGLEARSDYALKSIGIDRTYIGPYYEIVKTTNDHMGNYDRKEYGLSFIFQGLR